SDAAARHDSGASGAKRLAPPVRRTSMGFETAARAIAAPAIPAAAKRSRSRRVCWDMRLHNIAASVGPQPAARYHFPLLLRLIIALALLSPLGSAYSVLTHEAVVDSSWAGSIRPLLQKRFPNATSDQLREAHAYAYGGCIIQDMGYYPFGSKLLSDLVHYVRSGAFVIALLNEAQTLDEYAFALGALAHYTSDNFGHPIGVNRVEPLEYPKLRAKFGDVMTYEQDPA